MRESELEEFIERATNVSLAPRAHSIFNYDLPGYIKILFDYEDADDFFEFVKYFKTQLENDPISVYIKQLKKNGIYLSLLVHKDPAIVLTIEDLYCSQDQIETFLSQQPPDRGIYLRFDINQKPDTLEAMSKFTEKAMNSDIHDGIFIPLWKAVPLSTS